jgi:hypothetical protein
VRERLEAIGRSSSSLVLFLEHVPQTLAAWLSDRRDADPRGRDGSPYRRVGEALAHGTAFMSSRGLVHFDAHFRGLALSSAFDLSAAEIEQTVRY